MECRMDQASVERIQQWIEAMDQYNATPGEGTTRVTFSAQDLCNRAYVTEQMEKLGLEVQVDAIGNIFGTLPGECRNLAPVWTGSHIDTVPNGGKFDGMAGVAAGLEAVRLIRDAGMKHRRDICVVAYTAEEPAGYGLSCIGSRALAGVLTEEDTERLKGADGESLHEAMVRAGLPVERFRDLPKKKGEVYAAVELHVEQNKCLETEKRQIGIVTKICAPSNYLITVTGEQGHAGGTDMYSRKDAYAAACEMALTLEVIARNCDSEWNTATVGHVEVYPDSVNVIPGVCRFSVDIRDCSMEYKCDTIQRVRYSFQKIAERRGVKLTIQECNHDCPCTCDDSITRYMRDYCKQLGYSSMNLISGPYHDSLFLSYFTKVAMLFVPSKSGISHSPEEWTEYEDIARGTNVLAGTLLYLANK